MHRVAMSKTYCWYDNKSHKIKFKCRGSKAKYSKIYDKATNSTSENRRFQIINQMFATDQQTNKELFYGKRVIRKELILPEKKSSE